MRDPCRAFVTKVGGTGYASTISIAHTTANAAHRPITSRLLPRLSFPFQVPYGLRTSLGDMGSTLGSHRRAYWHGKSPTLARAVLAVHILEANRSDIGREKF